VIKENATLASTLPLELLLFKSLDLKSRCQPLKTVGINTGDKG
jgi:hypothetical protein